MINLLDLEKLRLILSSWLSRKCLLQPTLSRRSAARVVDPLLSPSLLSMAYLELFFLDNLFLSLVLQVLVKLPCWITYQEEISPRIYRELVKFLLMELIEIWLKTSQLFLLMCSKMISCSRPWLCVSASSLLLNLNCQELLSNKCYVLKSLFQHLSYPSVKTPKSVVLLLKVFPVVRERELQLVLNWLLIPTWSS